MIYKIKNIVQLLKQRVLIEGTELDEIDQVSESFYYDSFTSTVLPYFFYLRTDR